MNQTRLSLIESQPKNVAVNVVVVVIVVVLLVLGLVVVIGVVVVIIFGHRKLTLKIWSMINDILGQ